MSTPERERDRDDGGRWLPGNRDDGWREDFARPPQRSRHVEASPPHFRHALESSALAGAAVLLAAWMTPAKVPLAYPVFILLAVTGVTWYTATKTTKSAYMAGYLLAWGLFLTGWYAGARLTSPWKAPVIFALIAGVAILAPLGVVALGRHRQDMRRDDKADAERQALKIAGEWEDEFARFEVPGIQVLDVKENKRGGIEVSGRLGKAVGGRKVSTFEELAAIAPRLAVHRRLDPDGVYFTQPDNGSADQFTLHLRAKRKGRRPDVVLPMINKPGSINWPLGLGVLDDGTEFSQLMREVCVLIIGVRDAGKSNLINVFLARLAACPDALIFMIDMKGGRTARPWMLPWLKGFAPRPVIDWVATDREETKLMLETVMACGQARARSGIGWEKIEPSVDHPAVILICDDVSGCFGHGTVTKGEGGKISNYGLASLGSQIVELYRSEAIDLVGAGQRGVVDLWGNSGIKSQAEVRFGLRVTDAAEGQRIFPDYPQAAKMIARLRDPGSCLVKTRAGISPAVQIYRIPDQARIEEIALWTGDYRPAPEKMLLDVMGDAYARRWDRAGSLLETWREGIEADMPAPAAPAPASGGPDGDDQEWFNEEFNRTIAHIDDPEAPMDPRRRMVRDIVREESPAGISVARILTRLQNAGMPGVRETVQRWLADDEKKGMVRRGRDRNWRWVARDDDYPRKAM